jgi:hypothetical protein
MEKERTVVTIDGQLEDSDLGEIQRVRESAQGKVVLNLSGLDTCSDEGIRLLKRWLAGGAQLKRANPFLRMILKND